VKWQKLGQIIVPNTLLSWNQSHAMLPTADHIEGDIFRIYYSGRDKENRSHTGAVTINLLEPYKVLDITEKPLLSPGQLGCFDDNGVSPSCVLNLVDRKFLYYIGWKPRCTTRMSVVAGLAQSVDGGKTFSRVSRAPVLRRTDREPFGIMTAPWVLKDGDLFRMWYVSGLEWVHADLPRYNIKYAESSDGINWNQNAIVAIDARDEQETSLARPCVFKDAGIYKMYYSYKYAGANYVMGYAESVDGVSWTRMDDQVGIDRSATGWDSEMVEYGAVFSHRDNKYMLFNGNGYGASGAGLAILHD
jgi:hypothetical protein